MTNRELIKILDNLPQGMEVYIRDTNDTKIPLTEKDIYFYSTRDFSNTERKTIIMIGE